MHCLLEYTAAVLVIFEHIEARAGWGKKDYISGMRKPVANRDRLLHGLGFTHPYRSGKSFFDLV
jgi:hypothetical protein